MMEVIAIEKSHINYGQRRIEFQIERKPSLESKVLIHVEPSGRVIVEAPPQSTRSIINIAIRKRARWITQQQKAIQTLREHVSPRSYVSGETHFYLGRRYALKVISSENSCVKMMNGRLVVSTECHDRNTIKKLLSSWYKLHAARYLKRHVLKIANSMHWLDNPPPIRLLKMRKQWGSCSPSGTIILNPSLIKAPRECIEYVILHEVCHLKEHNHSPRFYKLLSKYMPDWESHKRKLDAMAEFFLIDE